jgi:hypothetical protein
MNRMATVVAEVIVLVLVIVVVLKVMSTNIKREREVDTILWYENQTPFVLRRSSLVVGYSELWL